MPLGTAAAIVGGGLLAGGSIGGFLSRPDRKSAAARRLRERAEDLQIPDADQFRQFRNMANEARPGLNELMALQSSMGGGQRRAQMAASRQSRQAAEQALDQFGQFRMQQGREANRLLSTAAQMQQQQRQARSRATMSLFNNIASLGGQIAGTAVGSMAGGGNASFGQMRRSGRRVPFGGSPTV